jgi:PTS system nitrogen regulatory IIA component
MISELLRGPDSVLCNVSVRSKKHCLEVLSELLGKSNPEMPPEEIFSKLIERERLGTTALGKGVAFPHCRFGGIEVSSGALLKLSEPVEFDSADGEPVDLVFGLMVPAEITDSHRDEIANIAEMLNDEAVQARLRAADSERALYEALMAEHRHERLRAGPRNARRGH